MKGSYQKCVYSMPVVGGYSNKKILKNELTMLNLCVKQEVY